MDPFPVWVLRARELGSGPPVRVVHVDRESRVFVAIHAERACLEHFGEDLLEWSSPAHMRHENWLREAHPQRWCLRNKIRDSISELHEKSRLRVAGSAFFVIDESKDVRPGLCDFNQVDYAVRKRVEASFELFGFGLAEPAISIDDHSSDGLARLLLVFLRRRDRVDESALRSGRGRAAEDASTHTRGPPRSADAGRNIKGDFEG